MKCLQCSHQLRTQSRLVRELSQRQLGFALLIALGKDRKEIAQENGTTPHNIAVHLQIVRDKLGVRNDVELALFLYGLLDQASSIVGELSTQ